MDTQQVLSIRRHAVGGFQTRGSCDDGCSDTESCELDGPVGDSDWFGMSPRPQVRNSATLIKVLATRVGTVFLVQSGGSVGLY